MIFDSLMKMSWNLCSIFDCLLFPSWVMAVSLPFSEVQARNFVRNRADLPGHKKLRVIRKNVNRRDARYGQDL
jgi:hypothetical protein